MVSSHLTLKTSASMIIFADMFVTVKPPRHPLIITHIDLGVDMTVIVLTHEIILGHMIPESEAESAFGTTHVIDSTPRDSQVDSNLKTDIHYGTMNIHVPRIIV